MRNKHHKFYLTNLRLTKIQKKIDKQAFIVLNKT